MSNISSPSFPGTTPRLGNYDLLMVLASGGMATVYAARQVGAAGFERLVVVKRVHAHLLEDREFYDMFRDEGSMASLVKHPNVVPVTDVVEADGELFLVMDYVDGAALSSLLKAQKPKNERMPPRVAARIVSDTLAGLHAAHEAVDTRGQRLDIVHRDVSPHNILVGADGITRLIDFGVAKAAQRSTQTRSGALKGKYPYMSPEQAQGMVVDRRADVFAAGSVLYEAITGKRLFQGDNDIDTLRRVVEEPIPKASSLVPSLPPSIDAVIQKALARDIGARFQTALDFLEALEQAMPPASPREVKAHLEKQCHERLMERRLALQGMMDGTVAPLSVRQSRDEAKSRSTPGWTPGRPSAAPMSSGTPPPVAAAASEVATISVPPASLPSLASLASASKSGTQITHDTPIARPAASRARTMVAVLIALAGVAAALLWWRDRHAVFETADITPAASSGAGSSALASASPSAAPSASANADTPDDEAVVTLVSDAPIESVHATGLRRVELAGTTAKLHIARWTGALAIEATLSGGKSAHATARDGDTRAVHLSPDTPHPVTHPTNTTHHPPPTGTGEELHPNPY